MADIAPVFKAGSYGVSFGAKNMGVTEVGFEMVQRPSFVPIRVDIAGRTPVDAIWTGAEDVIIRMESLEWFGDQWSLAIDWFKASTEGQVRIAGTLVQSLCKTLILTPVTTGQGIYTFTKAYPLEPMRSVFSSQRLRTVPLGFYCFASSVSPLGVSTVYAVT